MKSFIAFGSNLGERLANLSRAKTLLGNCENAQVVSASPVYETEPVGCPPDAQSFLNAVIEIETTVTPQQLLIALREIEESMGRKPSRAENAPRLIDLDLLCCDDLILKSANLILPHPRMTERRFVLEPLAAIHPDYIMPGTGKTVAQLLAGLKDTHWIKRFAEEW